MPAKKTDKKEADTKKADTGKGKGKKHKLVKLNPHLKKIGHKVGGSYSKIKEEGGLVYLSGDKCNDFTVKAAEFDSLFE